MGNSRGRVTPPSLDTSLSLSTLTEEEAEMPSSEQTPTFKRRMGTWAGRATPPSGAGTLFSPARLSEHAALLQEAYLMNHIDNQAS